MIDLPVAGSGTKYGRAGCSTLRAALPFLVQLDSSVKV